MSGTRDFSITSSTRVHGPDSHLVARKEGKRVLEDEQEIIDTEKMLQIVREGDPHQKTRRPPAIASPPMGITTLSQVEEMKEGVSVSLGTLEKRLVHKATTSEKISQEEAFDYLSRIYQLDPKTFNRIVKFQSRKEVDVIGMCIRIVNSNPEIMTNKDLAKETLLMSKLVLASLTNDRTYKKASRIKLTSTVYQTQKIYETFPVEFEDAVEYLSSLTAIGIFKQEFAVNRERILLCQTLLRNEWHDQTLYPLPFLYEIDKLIETNMNKTLRPLNQHNLYPILQDFQKFQSANPTSRMNFRKFLLYKGYNPIVKNVNFNLMGTTVTQGRGSGIPPKHGTDLLKGVSFEGFTFQNCQIRWINFSNSGFSNCKFKNCNLEYAVFKGSELTDVQFENCQMYKSSFYDAKTDKVLFNNCRLVRTNFNSATLSNTLINNCDLRGSSFFQTGVSNSKISKSKIGECVFYGQEDAFMLEDIPRWESKKPDVALLWEIDTPGLTAAKVESAMIKKGSNPVRIHYKPDFVDVEALDEEVKRGIQEAKDLMIARQVIEEDYEPVSIPMEMINLIKENPGAFPNIAKLLNYAKEVVKSHDLLLIPGGADIEPEFYGEKREAKTKCEPDYRRSIFEFSLLNEARLKGLPVMGICRGSQMGNVFYGGKILQNVEGQMMKIQNYTTKRVKRGEAKGMIRSTIGKRRGFKSISAHHQASAEVPSSLETVIEYQGIPKAMEKRDGAPTILLQFHPEFKADRLNFKSKALGVLLSTENNRFWGDFIKTGKAYRESRAAMKDVMTEIKMGQMDKLREEAEQQEEKVDALPEGGEVVDASLEETTDQ